MSAFFGTYAKFNRYKDIKELLAITTKLRPERLLLQAVEGPASTPQRSDASSKPTPSALFPNIEKRWSECILHSIAPLFPPH